MAKFCFAALRAAWSKGSGGEWGATRDSIVDSIVHAEAVPTNLPVLMSHLHHYSIKSLKSC